MKRARLYYKEDSNTIRLLHPDGVVEAFYLNESDKYYLEYPDQWFLSIFTRRSYALAKRALDGSHEYIGCV